MDSPASAEKPRAGMANVLDQLVVSLEPLGFQIEGPGLPPEEYSFYCEDVCGYNTLLTLELHPNFIFADAHIFPSEQSPDPVIFDTEFQLNVTAQQISDWVHASAKRLDDPGFNFEITIEED